MTAVEQNSMGDIGEFPDQPLQDRQMVNAKIANSMLKDNNIQPFGMDRALCSDLKTAGADLTDTEDGGDIKVNGDTKSEEGGLQHQHENGPQKGSGPPEDVACSECHGQFTSLQTYMEHHCKASKFSSQNENIEECDTAGESEAAVSLSGDESDLSDIENFEGEIVYRPDGSAYLVDGSELSDSENAQCGSKDPPSVVRQPLTDAGNMSAFPGIVNSLHVPAYMTIGNLAQLSMGQLATPIVHSFRVYDVRTSKQKDQLGSETKPREEEPHSISENAVEGHGKPILMCFLCKLSFGFAKSFVAHASNEHKLTLNEEERKIMARKGQSAIVQGLGKEKSPLLSFLEATAIKSQPGHQLNFKHTPPSSEYLQSVFPSAASSVSYVYPVNVTISTSSPLTTTVTATSTCMSQPGSVVAANVDTVPGSGTDGPNAPDNQAPPGLLAIAKSETDSAGPNENNVASPDNENNTEQEENKQSAEQSEILHKDHASPEQSQSTGTADGSLPVEKEACKLLTETTQETPSPSCPMKYLEPRKADVRQSPSPTTRSNCQTPHQQEAESPYPGSLAEESSSPRPSSRDTCTPSDCCTSSGKNSSSVECPKCDMVLGSSRSLGGHMTMMHSRNSCKTLKCPKCNWHYKYQQTLEAHMKEKHPESESKCPYCETNQTHPRLSRGETYTCGYKPYRCDICNYSTTTKGNLSIHMQSDKHLNNVQELQNGSDQLFMHTTKVGGEMPPTLSSSSTKAKPKHTWRCDVCDYETNVARNLRIHMTSEKHIHNMMAIQQNVSQMQREMQTNLTGFQPEESMYMYMAQNMLPIMAQGPEGMDMQSMMNYSYDPTAYAAMMGSMALGVAPGPDQTRMQEEQAMVSPDDLQNNEPLRLYQCSVCNKFSTDCLGELQQHISRDRSEPNEELWRIIIGDVQQCALCNYTTQVKANFQLHMKTDKHQQKLQLFNHIREGGKQNEWRLKYMNVGNPIQLRCNACDYYTYSTDKLHTHTHSSNYRHETSMKLFRHLQKINITINPESRTFHCPLCNYSTKAKLNLIQHVQSLQHIKNEEKLTKASPKEGMTADGALDLSRKERPSPTFTASTSRDKDKEHGEPEAKRPKLPQESSSSGRSRAESRSNPNTTQIYSCPYCKYSSIDQQRISAHVVSQHSIKPQAILRCPLCQEVCTNKINLEVHLMDTHSVSRECMQRLMLTSEWVMPTATNPPATTPPFIQGTNPAMEALAQAGLKPAPAESPAPPSVETVKMELQDKPARESPGPSSDTESTDLYRCQKCHLVFANIDQLYAHQDQSCPLTEQDTPGGPGFLCWKKGCNQYFKTASALQMHFKEIHAKRQQSASSERHMYKYRCTQCSLAFKTEEKLGNHMQYHLLRAATKCPVCQRMFRSVPALQNHIETSHQDLSNTELLQYYNSVSNGDMVPSSKLVEDSPSCGEVPNENEQVDPSQDDNQMEAESVDGTIDSSDAGKDDTGRQVETPNSQEVDSLSEDGSQDGNKYIDDGSYTDPVRKYKCHRCRLGFMRQSELSSHNKTMTHRKGDRSLTAFQLQRYWDPNRPYKCDVCKESFTQKNILLVHYNSVSHLHKLKQSLNEPTETEAAAETGDGKPYRCNLCKVAYSQATTLETHMRSVLHQSRAAKQEVQGTSTEREESTPEQSSSVENGELGSPKVPGYSTPQQQVQEMQAQQLQQAQAAQQMQLQMQQIQLHQLQQLQQAQLQHFLQQQGMTQIQSEAAQQLQAELALATLAGFPPGMMLQPGQVLPQPCVFSCNKCSSVFVSQEALTQHQQTQCRSVPSSENATTAATPPATPKPSIPEASINQHPRRTRTSQVQRKLLESYGFDLVQQFNEFAQGLPASIAQEDKFYCSECSKEFSSIFVYKAHLEELHKKVLTIKEIEMYSKKFKEELLENNIEDEKDKTEMDKQDREDKPGEKQLEQNGEVKEEPNTDGSTHTQISEDQHIAAQLAAVQYLQQTQQQGQMSASQAMPPPPPPQMLLPSAFPLSMMQSMQPLSSMQNFSMMQGITPTQASMPAMQAVQYVDPNYMQKSPKRARTRITDDQLKILRAYFDINNSPTEEQIAEMSQKSGLPHKVIKHWFRNTLFKERQRNKDSPYNFNNPPTTTLQDAEKSAQLKAKQEVAAAQAAALAAEQAAAACAAAAAAAAASAAASAAEAKRSSPAPISVNGGFSNSRKRSKGSGSYFSESDSSLSMSASTSIPVVSLPSACVAPPASVPFSTAALVAAPTTATAAHSSPPSAPSSACSSSPKPDTKKVDIKQESSQPEQQKSSTPPPADSDTHTASKNLPVKSEVHVKSEDSQKKSPVQRDRESIASVSSVNSVFTSEPQQGGVGGPVTTTSSPTTPTSTYSELASPILSPISPAPQSMPSATSPTQRCSGSGSKRSGRTRFTDYQVKVLQEFFENNAYPKDDDLDNMSRLLNLSPRVIVVWFQNARQKARKIFENQPLVDSGDSEGEGSSRYKRTPGMNYQCSKCLLVFQRFYELIRHQKLHCYKDEEGGNRSSSQVSPTRGPTCTSPMAKSTASSTSSVSSETVFTKSEEKVAKVEAEPKAESKPSSTMQENQGPVVHYQCEKCSLVFPHFDQWRDHQQVHMMNMGLFGSYLPQPYNMMYLPYPEAMNGVTPEQYLNYLSNKKANESPTKRKFSETSDDIVGPSTSESPADNGDQPKDKRLRTTISPAQLDVLYAKYREDSNPTRRMLDMISKEVGLKKRVVQVWFQNTRARERKGQFRLSGLNQMCKCPFCRALFKSKSALEAHIRTRHFEQQITNSQMEAILAQMPECEDTGMLSPQFDSTTGNNPYSTSPSLSQDGEHAVNLSSSHKERRKGEELIVISDDSSSQDGADNANESGNSDESGTKPRVRNNSGHDSEGSRRELPKQWEGTPSRSGSESSQLQMDEDNKESDMLSPTSSMVGEDFYENTLSEAGSMDRSEDSFSNLDEGERMRMREANKRYRTQMSQLQLKVLKHCFADYRTPTMHECELLGQEVGLPKRVVQVWFQNARAKDKKSKTVVTKQFGMIGPSSDGTPEMCKLCGVKYSMSMSVRDHVFTELHIRSVKKHVGQEIEKDSEDSARFLSLQQKVHGQQSQQQQQQQSLPASQQFLPAAAAAAAAHAMMPAALNPVTAAQIQTIQAMHAAQIISPQMASQQMAAVAAAAGMLPGSSGGSSKQEGRKELGIGQESKDEEQASQQAAAAQQQAAAAAMLAQQLNIPTSRTDQALMSYLYGNMPPYYSQMQMMYPFYTGGQEAAMMAAYEQSMQAASMLPQMAHMYGANPLAAAQLQSKSTESAVPKSSASKEQQESTSFPGDKDRLILRPKSSTNRYLCKKCEKVFTDRDSVTSHQVTACYPGQVVNTEETVEKLPSNRFLCLACPREVLITEEDVNKHLQSGGHERNAALRRASGSGSSKKSHSSKHHRHHQSKH
ncbi:zinc finger homeobox protein 4-like [Acanthaster planci]|uniref:Zinc finger homeobox protein 4-like n=1 Tax=Acanthaster planci TaxID=133434 RepID=A0A8B7YH51_ACAPL|nr:zinc finger homeobox protein 4-like [Acanthaster planci]XP_022091906.1 zinc finger homeobox protein 4-like [Acanthaster planci]XP_022091907.1 zinc finger homeobox protein 4-like [Acanthaster planci]XP_022091908.1 zinc finger homeobox protein 4-like [Acanthaster planci]XP_022091909.1 zinc finger homeobox protein 4-like [Acanthaster planci]XP_022091911.1 zinc finger homeobox protein 4-like [Acanthaster planci]XP_022091912.1 zinc finger homeobox protein 4-like [Acanthaster planci]XP_02209191